MSDRRAIVLIDGEHHPDVVADALAEQARRDTIVAVVFCGGTEKVAAPVLDDARGTYGYDVMTGTDPVGTLRDALARVDADMVIDLADEPRVATHTKLQLAAVAGAHGLAYEAPGLRIEPPALPAGATSMPVISLIGTGKRTGKTAVCTHLARALRTAGARPAIVSMGRGGPREPALADADTGLVDLLALADAGVHAASDYLEDAVLAGVPAVGCRRVGGGPGGGTWQTNFAAGFALAAGLEGVDTLLLEGSGATIPSARADATICVVGASPARALELDGGLRPALADLVLLHEEASIDDDAIARFTDARIVRFGMCPVLADDLPPDARVAFFTTGAGRPAGIEPVVVSRNLADRAALAADLAAAAEADCTHYATELKAAAIDTVATAARDRDVGVVFVRNEPFLAGASGDRDELAAILVDLHSQLV